MDCFLSQQRTVYFYRWKSIQCFHNCFIGNFQSFIDALSFYQLCCHAAGCNCSAAAEGFEFDITDDLVLINIKIDSHDITAFCITYGTNSAGILDLSYVSRMLEMIHYFITIHIFFLFSKILRRLDRRSYFCFLMKSS